MKKVLSLILSIALVFGIFASVPYTESAFDFLKIKANAADVSDFTFSLNTDGASYAITDCNDTLEGEVIIPSEYNNLPVVEIADSVFYNLDNVTSIIIPDTVTTIGNGAFENCSKLASVTLPEGLIKINQDVFRNCTSLTNIVIPDNVETIGIQAFYSCSSLTSVVIPDSVLSIGYYAFGSCISLASVTIGKNVSYIESYAFGSCSNLNEIIIPDTVTGISGSVFNSTPVYSDESKWDNGILYIDNHLIATKDTIYGEITIKEGTKSIANSAFSSRTRVTNVIFSEGLAYIGSSAFSGCTGLTSITIPDGVKTIEKNAFSGCTGVKTFTVGSGIENVGDNLLGSNSVYIEEINVDSEIVLPKLPLNSSLKKVTLGNNITAIPDYAFDECTGLTEITIPNSVTTIGEQAFYSCTGLTEITIPDSVTSVGNNAFSYCTGLTEITIPDSVTSIGYTAFASCSALSRVTIGTGLISYIEGSDEGKAFVSCNSIEEINVNTDFALTLFNLGKNLKKVTLGNNITVIPDYAFDNCTGLTEITIPDSVTSIGAEAFRQCDNLAEVIISGTVTTIGDYAFAYCYNLNSISFPETPIEIGESILEESAYYNDNSNWENGALYVGKHLIRSNSNSEFTVKDGTVSIVGHAIINNNREITLPESLQHISNGAFEYAEELDCVFFKGTQEQWEEITIGDNNDYLEDASYHFGMTSHTPGDEWFISDGYNCDSDGGYKYKKCTVCGGECEKEEISGHVFTDAFCDYCGVCQYYYTIEEGKVTITGVRYQREEMVIPETIEGYHVVAIGERAFYDYDNFVSIIIPDTVTFIGQYAFWGCSSLETVELSENLVVLEYGVFESCPNLTKITIPDSIKTIGESAFYGCSSLTAITIPASVTSISYQAFSNCSSLAEVNLPQTAISMKSDAFDSTVLYNSDSNWDNGALYVDNHLIRVTAVSSSDFVVKEGTITVADNIFYGYDEAAFLVRDTIKTISFPASLMHIGEYNFSEMHYLTAINVADGNQYYSSKEGVLFNKSLTCLIRYPNYLSAEKYVVPETVTELAPGAFCQAQIYNVVLPYGLTKIGDSAFGRSWINKVVIPTGVTKIEKNTFKDAYRLESIAVSSSVTIIDESAFRWCSGLKYVFYDGNEAQWSEITIDVYNTDLTDAFIHYNSTDHTASDWITDTEPTYTNQGTKHKECIYCGHTLENDYIPVLSGFIYKAVDMSSYKLASYLGMAKNVTVPTTNNNCPVTEIGEGCFKDNQNVTRVIIPIGVTKIGYLAFMNCKSLEYVSIPATVTEIGMQAFYGFEGIILCQKDSVAHQYAVENDIDYVFPTIEAADSRSKVDFEYQMIYTSVANCTDITEIIVTPPTMISLPVAKDGESFYGTGATITIFDGVDFRGDYTIIVQADMNGDGVCNVIDVSEAERMASGHKEATLEQIYAANGEAREEFSVSDYQSVVNCALSV